MGDADFDKSAYAAGRLAPAARDDAADLALALWRNEALCCLKLDEWREAEAACSRAFDRRTHDAKALYRRGVARTRLGDVDGALADLRAASATRARQQASATRSGSAAPPPPRRAPAWRYVWAVS